MIRHGYNHTGRRASDPRRLWTHYVVTLLLVLVVLVGAHAWQTQSARTARTAAEVVSLGSQLHTLTERILRLADIVNRNANADDLAELDAALVDFRASGRALQSRLTALSSHEGQSISLGFGLEEVSEQFLAHAAEVGSAPLGSDLGREHLRALHQLGQGGLDHGLVNLMATSAADVGAWNAQALRLERVTLVLVFGVILAGSVLIAGPAHRAIVHSYRSLEAKNLSIRKKNDQLEDYASRLAFSAFHDPLTGLTNRKRLHESLEQMLMRDDVDPQQICVMHIDLDRFKQLNDELGHAVGDATLKRVAEIMRKRMCSEDVVARVGGDEFVIAAAFEDADSGDRAQHICDDHIGQIREPMVVHGLDVKIGASIGYAFASEAIRDAETLISNADIALYDAKRAGKGVARPFTGSMRDSIERRRTLVADMERALEAGEFIPYFQPLVALETGEVLGLEMLARWNHPVRGLVAPADFMEIAEEIGMVDAIDARVLLDGLGALAALRHEGWEIPRLSLNASARTMRYTDYAERLTDAITARDFSSSDVVVEVQETTLIADSHDQAAQTISALRTAGYNVYVDDFGTGYSSLSDLASLDVNGLKIDQMLVAELESQRAQQVVGAIVGLARAMSMTVIAEGVETAAQYRRLRQLGTHAGQGFGIADPMPLGDARAWLDSYGKELLALG